MEESYELKQTVLPAFLKEIKILEYYQMLKASNNEDRLLTIKNGQLTRLDLSNMSISKIPTSITKFGYLKELYLDNCTLSTLPDEICLLSELEIISLQNNNFNSLPTGLNNLPNIKKINLKQCGIVKSIDGSFFAPLKHLSTLNLSNIGLEGIDGKFISPPNLKLLNLNNNKLSYFNIDPRSNVGLIEMNLGSNYITHIPLEVSMMYSLERLYLDHNNIENITPEITNLYNLIRFDVSDNGLSDLDVSLCYLESLKYLNCENNNILSIPTLIKKLDTLEELWLADNNITHLPEEIGELVNLKLLRVNNNNLSSLPQNILLLDLDELNLLQNKLPSPFNFICLDNDNVQEFYQKICNYVRTNNEQNLMPNITLREISRLHIFLNDGLAILTYNGLTNTIEEMDTPLAGVFQIAMSIIDMEGKSFIPIKDRDDRTIQITVVDTIGLGFDLLGFHTSAKLHDDYYLKTAVHNFVHKYGDKLRDGVLEIDNDDIKSAFRLYLGET